MNSMTRPRAMVSEMRLRSSSVTVELLSFSHRSWSLPLILFRRRGGQRERVNRRARAGDGIVQGRVNQPVTLDRALAGERRGHHGRVEVVATARRVDDADVRVRQGRLNARADVIRCHSRYIARGRRISRRYTWPRMALGTRMTLGTRVTLVTTTVIASVLAGSGYAALKVRRANLEADLDREAHEIAAGLGGG